MKGNLNYGIIIKELRKRKGMRLKDLARELGRSAGWLSDVENCNGKCTASEDEFKRVVAFFEAESLRPQFKSWVAKAKKAEGRDSRFDGVILRHLRQKKGMALAAAAAKAGVSTSYLSKIERGKVGVSAELRNRIISACGYSSESFKNLSVGGKSERAVNPRLKLEVLLNGATDTEIERLIDYFSAIRAK